MGRRLSLRQADDRVIRALLADDRQVWGWVSCSEFTGHCDAAEIDENQWANNDWLLGNSSSALCFQPCTKSRCWQ